MSATAPGAAPDLGRRTAAILVGGLLLAGALLRLFRLDALPLWNDECIQLNGIQLPFAELRTRHLFTIDHMPPLSYWIQRAFWILSPTTFAIRLPGALAGALMVLLAYRTLRPALSRTVSAAAAGFTAGLFFLVYFSQECRTYIFFGAGIWLFLGDWLRMLSDPAAPPPGPRVLARWLAGALLCSAFHFSAALLVACVGLTTGFVLLADAAAGGGPASARLRAAFRRGAPMAVTLAVALGATWLAMRYFLGPKMGAMVGQARESVAVPAAATLGRALLPVTFGGGWRLLPFALLAALGATAPRPATRRAARIALALLAVSVAAGAWLFPRLGFWSLGESAARYYFWWSWSAVVVLAAGVERLAGGRPLRGLAIAALLAAVPLARPYALYYRSASKWFDVRAMAAAVEALPGERLLLLHNGYDGHQLQFYWPRNSHPAAAPTYERATYESLGIGEWTARAVEQYPDTVFKTSWHRALEPGLEARLRAVFAHSIAIGPDPAAAALVATGLHPLQPVESMLFFNDEADLAERARTASVPVVRFPATMPLTSTRNPEGGFAFWRALTAPARLVVLRGPAAAGADAIRLPVARLDVPAAIVARVSGAVPVRLEIAPAPVEAFDPEAGGSVHARAGIAALVSVETRVPLRIARAELVIPLPPGADRVEIELTPETGPSLIGPPSP